MSKLNHAQVMIDTTAIDYDSFVEYINSLSDIELREVVINNLLCIYDSEGDHTVYC
jgi:hypothetical protein